MNQDIPRIGRPFLRPDAASKAAGLEKYAADHYGEDLLWAGAKRAGIPHGRIRGVDIGAAAALPGVVAVLTGRDVPGTNRQGIVHKDQPVLCDDVVRHYGDPVALVIAEDRSALQKALGLVRLDIEPLPGVFGIDEALLPDAPLVHEGRPTGNTLLQTVIRKGDAEAALWSSPVRVEGIFEVPFIAHAFLETENGVARQEADGRIVLIVSTQAPFRDRWEVGHALGIPMDRIRIVGPYLGGGFGGKDGATVQCLLALAALHAGGRPVKMWWSREENFLAGYKRHAARMHYRLGASENGELQALDCRLYYDTGAYAHLGGEVMALGMEHASGPYRIPHTRIEGVCVYTNNPIGGAMRGFGVAQVSFAVERMMDRLAGRLGMDPLALRLRNALEQGDTNGCGVRLTQSTGIRACLEALREHPVWLGREAWKAEAGPFRKRGVGVAALWNAMGYGRGLPDSAIAKVELTREGAIRVYNGVSDMGQGNTSALFQIAGEILRQPETCIEGVQPDTERTYPSGSAAASRTTYTYGNALIQACEELRRRILGWAALMLFADTLDDLELLPGRVRYAKAGKEAALRDIAAMMRDEVRVCISQFIMPVALDAPKTGKEFVIGFPHLLFSHAAHLARVEVDELTGAVTVDTYCAATEAGRVLNPQTFEQQVEGAVAQGIGYALSEAVRVEEGRILTPDFATYIIPGAIDVPEIASIVVEDPEATGPFGLKGVGEVGMNGPLPSIANAVSDACGIEPDRAPLTGERILALMRGDSAASLTE
ncbi:Xanthine dehydrogenase, molybdenum binding subunit apoprotein [uncultured Desulfatiglans sp.]|uniref:Xanthine dehydrogenase, molybdenum binding subunit apoprotein n=1 Tax=Uncultured Desulfatiglans sp. TaxID=1748965 RepID=A0A653AEW6_UNCDX|nr:Xanthine dehydrogenase, molybdenum binding subunit apoprotein [uncultured Desulfatiglans sp.]